MFHPVSKVSPVISSFPGVCPFEEVWADGSVRDMESSQFSHPGGANLWISKCLLMSFLLQSTYLHGYYLNHILLILFWQSAELKVYVFLWKNPHK